MKRILVVDDAAILRRILKGVFQKHGFTVVGEAQDGVEAIQMYRELQPDLVTMDLTMPRLDGIAASRQILNDYPEARIVVVSSVADHNVVSETKDLGVRDYIVKPFREDQIIAVLKRVLEIE